VGSCNGQAAVLHVVDDQFFNQANAGGVEVRHGFVENPEGRIVKRFKMILSQ